jgi:putative transposase
LVGVHRAYTFRLHPTVGQRARLVDLLAAMCELYNAGLEARRGAWRWERRRVTRFEQYRELTGFDWEPLATYGVCVARGTLARLDEAFKGFFRRLATGQKPGYPRFRSARRFDSASWPERSGWAFDFEQRRLRLKGVGTIRVLTHGRIRGTPKTITVRRRGRHWELTVFCAGVEPEPLPPTGREVGIDRGVAVLAATSDGQLVPNPRPRRALAERVAAAQADKARRKPGSQRHRRAAETVARLRRKEANVRRDAAHQLSRRLVNGYDLICLERLRVTAMCRSARGTVEDPGTNVAAKAALNDAIADSGWQMLARFITYKAEDAGRCIEWVEPRNTSRTCSGCGHLDPASRRSQSMFVCTRCGHSLNADVNAARNVLRAGHARHFGAKPDQLANLAS